MTYPLLRFVEAPEKTATVRMNLQSGPARVASDGFSIGAPSLIGDPGTLEPELGHRRLTMRLRVDDVKSAATPVVAALSREVLRRGGNWLMFQLTPSSKPYWFRTYVTEPGDISLDDVYNEDLRRDLWEIAVALDAEALAWGERVTFPAQSLSNDSPKRFTLPAVIGDGPAPAKVVMRTDANRRGKRHMMPLSRGIVILPVGTGDIWSPQFDTGAPVADAAMVGGSYRSVSFATQTGLVSRLLNLTAADIQIVPGRYSVLVRVRRPNTTGTFQMQWGVSDGSGSLLNGDIVTIGWDTSPAAHSGWIPLGDFAIPANALNVPDWSPLAKATAPVQMELKASRLTGTSALHLDHIALIPVRLDTRSLIADHAGSGPSNDVDQNYDGDVEAYYPVTHADGKLAYRPTPALEGQFPQLAPGEANELSFFDQISLTRANYGVTADVSDAVSAAVRAEVSYHPRYLYVAT